MRCHHAAPPSRPADRRQVRRSVLALAAALAGVLLAPPLARAQTSPLTLQPATGRVGVGTTTPAQKLDIADNNALRLGYVYVSSGIPASGHAAFGTNAWYNGTTWVIPDAAKKSQLLQFYGDGFYIWQTQTAGQANWVNRLTIAADGKLGIGTTAPGATLDVNGTVSASVKAFRIPHPIDPARKDLAHASLEGPEIGVYYRGEAQLDKGEAVVTLPAYFEALTEAIGRTVQLTPVGGWSPLYVVSGVLAGRFIVRAAAGGDPSQRFYWEVKAVRRDVPALVLEPPKKIETIVPPMGLPPPTGG